MKQLCLLGGWLAWAMKEGSHVIKGGIKALDLQAKPISIEPLDKAKEKTSDVHAGYGVLMVTRTDADKVRTIDRAADLTRSTREWR